MEYFAHYDINDGRIISTASAPHGELSVTTGMLRITATQYPTIKSTHRVSLDTLELVSGAIADPSPPSLANIRTQRDVLLIATGQRLTEYMLPDSFPKITPAQKQAKIDALISYRQALRDIDPANIVWPTQPA